MNKFIWHDFRNIVFLVEKYLIYISKIQFLKIFTLDNLRIWVSKYSVHTAAYDSVLNTVCMDVYRSYQSDIKDGNVNKTVKSYHIWNNKSRGASSSIKLTDRYNNWEEQTTKLIGAAPVRIDLNWIRLHTGYINIFLSYWNHIQ